MTTSGAFARDPPVDASVAELIRFGAAEFERAGLAFGHGTGTAVDDAAALVFHALGLDHDRAAEAYEIRPDASSRAAVLALFAERIGRRVPAAYLMGRMWFAGLEFEIDSRVIVPRSPFAELILASFRPWVDPARVRRVLDLGTGSGCIAIACALALPHAKVDAVEISPEALEIARRNVTRHSVADRVQLLAGDLYEPVTGRRYDLILSNPPYVSDAEMARLPGEYAHEPALALRAGADGLDVARRILAGAAHHMEPGGTLFVEVGDSDARLDAAFPELAFTWLEFEHGGGGVFRLTRAELEAHDSALRRRSKHVG
jgi:ribosomal protein L3 glutamine methyltransferase